MASTVDNSTLELQVSNTSSDRQPSRGRGLRGSRGTRGDRGNRGFRGSRGITVSSQSRTHGRPAINDPGEQSSNTAAIPPILAPSVVSIRPQQEDGETTGEADVCFICASEVIHQCLAPCNHRTCHICGLRMRALYKNKDCAHCRVSHDGEYGSSQAKSPIDPSQLRDIHRQLDETIRRFQ